MDSEVKAIVSKAMNGGLLSEREIRALFSVKDFSPESAYIQWAARSFSSALMKSKAEVHGQLGIDTGQCLFAKSFCVCSSSCCCSRRQIGRASCRERV